MTLKELLEKAQAWQDENPYVDVMSLTLQFYSDELITPIKRVLVDRHTIDLLDD